MTEITIRMLGKFSAKVGDVALGGMSASKVQELFAYLLLHRNRPQSREVLASLLWADTETCRAKKYLRQALWQLQSALRPLGAQGSKILCIDPEWIEFRTVPHLRLDVALLEEVHSSVAPKGSALPLPVSDLERLRAAVAVYDDHLLAGWYQDWCSYERERLQGIYLALLDLLMADCEARADAEEGLRYGVLSLRLDPARERTHQRMMRLHSLFGDRAEALRQYDRCVIAMDEELGVAPAQETRALYEQIRVGGTAPAPRIAMVASGAPCLGEVLARLKHISSALDDYRHELQSSIDAVEMALGGLKHAPVALPVRRTQAVA